MSVTTSTTTWQGRVRQSLCWTVQTPAGGRMRCCVKQSYHSTLLHLLLVTHIPIFILKIHVCATHELQCSREERGKGV